MLQHVVHPPEQLHDDDISSPISSQLFDFLDSELFQETIQTSEATSCSNGCYEENTSYASNFSIQDAENKACQEIKAVTASTATANNTAATSTITTATNFNNNNSGNLSINFDSPEEIENDISASIDFSPSSQFSVPPYFANQQDQFGFSSAPPAVPITNVAQEFSQYSIEPASHLIGPPIPSVFEDDCLSSVPSFMTLNPTSPACSFLGPAMSTYFPGTVNATISAENPGIFSSSLLTGSELQPHELDYQGDNAALFCQDSFPRVFNPPELQAFRSESQPLVAGCVTSTPLASEITSLDDPTLKVGKLTAEQRKEKIHRYLKKRNERNFSKKIKYACRKTLADSRPRVRGRFAKNDDFGEAHRNAYGHQEDADDDQVREKEEDDLMDSSDIFANITGVNSFKCNYLLPYWI